MTASYGYTHGKGNIGYQLLHVKKILYLKLFESLHEDSMFFFVQICVQKAKIKLGLFQVR